MPSLRTVSSLLVLLLAAFAPCAVAQEWTEQNSGVANNIILKSVCFIDRNNGWVVGTHGTILHTTNGGDNWVPQTSATTRDFTAVTFLDNSHGWAVNFYGTILRTTNGGVTWTEHVIDANHAPCFCIAFLDFQTGWAAGDGSYMRHTTDGGITWTNQGGLQPYSLSGVTFLDANTGWAVGDFGAIRHTTDAGVTWTAQTSGTTQALRRAVFTDAQNGWIAVGNYDTTSIILHTTNAGVTWLPESNPAHTALYAMDFADPLHGWAVGFSGRILHTNDGGANWRLQDSAEVAILEDVCFVDAGHGWAVGFDGKILYYEAPVSVPPANVPLPQQTALAPAYPNPFNPTTTLAYTLAQRGRVSVIIYDLAGREITTLLQSTQPAGHYSLPWTAAALPSGVYLCRLTTPTVACTQKLLLVK